MNSKRPGSMARVHRRFRWSGTTSCRCECLPALGVVFITPGAAQTALHVGVDILDTTTTQHNNTTNPPPAQHSNESEGAFSSRETQSELPLWGSVMLTKDKDAVERMIQQQTQV